MNPILLQLGASLVGVVALVYTSIQLYKAFANALPENNERVSHVRSTKRKCHVCLCELLSSGLNRQENLTVSLPCGHKFHTDCITSVLESEDPYHRYCPECRKKVSETFFNSLK